MFSYLYNWFLAKVWKTDDDKEYEEWINLKPWQYVKEPETDL